MRYCPAILPLLLALTFPFAIVQAQIPQLINFQARVDGLNSDRASVTFSIYNSLTGGSELWKETYDDLMVPDSMTIQVLLGSENSFDPGIFSSHGERYLAISINGEELMPRSRIASVAYALRAQTADSVAGGDIELLFARTDSLSRKLEEEIASLRSEVEKSPEVRDGQLLIGSMCFKKEILYRCFSQNSSNHLTSIGRACIDFNSPQDTYEQQVRTEILVACDFDPDNPQ